jgi:hypothetical protein
LENLEKNQNPVGPACQPQCPNNGARPCHSIAQSKPRQPPTHTISTTIFRPQFLPASTASRGYKSNTAESIFSLLPPRSHLFSTPHTLPPLHPNDRPSKPLKSRPGVPSLCRQADAQFGRPVNSSGIPMSFLPSTSSTASASPRIPSSSHRPSQPAPPLAPHR